MITSYIWPHPLPYGDPRHGTANGYTNLGCRCPDCQTSNARRSQRGRSDRAARLAADPSLAPHGKASTYKNWKCRCRSCTTAYSAEALARRHHARARRRAAP